MAIEVDEIEGGYDYWYDSNEAINFRQRSNEAGNKLQEQIDRMFDDITWRAFRAGFKEGQRALRKGRKK